MARAWRAKLSADQLRMLQDGYSPFGLPFYGGAEDWSI
jgi:hypothetical protein